MSKSSKHLEIVRPKWSGDDEISHIERRLLPRICLSSEQFKLIHTGKLFSAVDLSETGLALWVPEKADFEHFVVGFKLAGILNLKHEKFPVEVQVQNISSDRVGCTFVSSHPELIQSLARFFDPAYLGTHLKPIPSQSLNGLGFHGPSGTYFVLRKENGSNDSKDNKSIEARFDQMTLYFHGLFVQWEANTGLTSGRVTVSNIPAEIRGIFRLETLFLERDSGIDKKKLGVAREIIQNAHVPDELKGWCVRHFSN